MKLAYLLAAVACTTAGLRAQTTEQATNNDSPGWHEHAFGKHYQGGMAWKRLNLTDQQRSQIKAVKENFRKQPTFRSALASYLTAKNQLTDAVNANDPGKIREVSTNLAAAEADFASQRAQELVQVKAVLTPEQLTTWNQMQQKRASHLQQRIERLNQAGS